MKTNTLPLTHQSGDHKPRSKRRKVRKSTIEDQAAIQEMVARFPVFAQPVPLKLGINSELQAFCRAAVPEDVLSRTRVRRAVNYFLSQWTRQTEYLAAVAQGGPRFDLWMKSTGGVIATEIQHAQRTAEQIEAEARKPALRPKPQRGHNPPQQPQKRPQGQQQRSRHVA